MAKYTIQDFVSSTAQKDRGEGAFELESSHMLEINLNGMVWIKTGAMVGYVGGIKFEREGMFDHGVDKFLKKAITGEGTHLTKATGMGSLYCADRGKKISILNLANETIIVNGNDLLAFEPTVKWDITMMRRAATALAGGLFNVKLQGTGMIAITTHYEPLTLMVTPDRPVRTDPNATVAWSGSLSPELKADINLKTILGRSSGETLQMEFRGNGFVVIQPYEEIYFQAGAQSGTSH